MLWIWGPICALTAAVLLLGCYEVALGPGYIVPVQSTQEILSNFRNVSANRLFIFLVGGLRNASGLTPPNSSSYGLVNLKLSYTRTTLVALASGRYDPITSSVLGWPSDSDNIFYYTDKNYFFGPDTTPNYFKTSLRWTMDTYPSDWLNNYPENVGHTLKPDQYVVDKTLRIIRKVRHLSKQRKQIFLIQLESINLAAKADGVKSIKSAEAVLSVESSIAKIQRAAEIHFKDNDTSYLILSTHGTDKHGRSGGSTSGELHVPMYFWGKGSSSNGFQKTRRHIIDLCPLLATVLGITIPLHSRGKLPAEYMTSDMLTPALAFNGLQLGSLCKSLSRAAGPLTKRLVGTSLSDCMFNDYMFNLTAHLDKGLIDTAASEATSLIEVALTCTNKLEGFYTGSVLFTISMTYLAWVGLLCSSLAPPSPPPPAVRNWMPFLISMLTHGLFIFKILIVAMLIWIENWPWYLLPLFELPVFLWWTAVARSERLWLAFCKDGIVKSALFVGSTWVVVEIVYWTSFRLYFGILFIIPYTAWTASMNARFVPNHVSCVWIASSIILILLPGLLEQFQEAGKASAAVLNVGAAIWIIGGCLFAYRMDLRIKEHIVTALLAGFGTMSIWVVDLYHLGVWEFWMRTFSWVLLPTPIFTAFGSSTLSTRLMQVCLSLSVPLFLVSVGEEPFYFLLLSINLYAWLRLEASSPQYQYQDYLRLLALHFYLNYAILILGPTPIIFTYAHNISPYFIAIENHWLNVGLNWCRLTLGAALIAAFWSATNIYIGNRPSRIFKCWLVLGSLTAARHCFGLVIAEEQNLSVIVVAHFMFFIVLIPFTISPVVLLVTKYRHTL